MNNVAELDILDHSISQLETLLGHETAIQLLKGVTQDDYNLIDGWIDIGGERLLYEVKDKLVSLKEIVNQHAVKKGKGEPVIFFLQHTDLASRIKLEKAKVNYVDNLGNCFLDLAAIKAVVNVRDEASVKTPYSGKSFQKKGLIFLFHVLALPTLLSNSYRTISGQTGVSTGALSGIFEDLRLQGFLKGRGKKQALQNVRQLVKRWSYAYLDNLRPGLYRGLFRSTDGVFVDHAQAMGINDKIFLSGEYAAMMVGDYLNSSHPTVYTSLRITELVGKYALLPLGKSEQEKPIEVLQPFWNVDILPEAGFALLFAPDVLIYADLLLSHDVRILESAKRLLDNEIRNRFESAGFQW